MRANPFAWSAAALVVVALSGCGSTSDNQDPGAGSTGVGSTASQGATSDAMSGDITVFAAASLTGSFTELGKQFEAAHPGTTVTFSFAASSALAQQINSGAPADVFASASQKNMDQVVSAGGASDAKVFAKNVMEVATPPNNPAGVMSVNDLAKSSVKTALCQPQVPCGSVAEKVFSNAKLTVKPVTLEPDVKSVLSKVQLGEVDAGVVYVTDVMAAGDKVKSVEIPADVNASTSYPIAALTKSGNASVAAAFVDFVLSPAGQGVLSEAGFQGP
ncbi:molybdate ABC transporter substrate-binding protein [Intrasporangium mesophilum]